MLDIRVKKAWCRTSSRVGSSGTVSRSSPSTATPSCSPTSMAVRKLRTRKSRPALPGGVALGGTVYPLPTGARSPTSHAGTSSGEAIAPIAPLM